MATQRVRILFARIDMTSESIVAAYNTYNPCLLILCEKRYELQIENYTHLDGDVTVRYSAVKGEWRFAADSAPELLGLVVLHETYGDDWNRQEPSIIADMTVNTFEKADEDDDDAP